MGTLDSTLTCQQVVGCSECYLVKTYAWCSQMKAARPMSSSSLQVRTSGPEVVLWYLRGIDFQDLILSTKLPTCINYLLEQYCSSRCMSMNSLISCGEDKVETLHRWYRPWRCELGSFACCRTHALDLGPPSKTAEKTGDASCKVPEAHEKSSRQAAKCCASRPPLSARA